MPIAKIFQVLALALGGLLLAACFAVHQAGWIVVDVAETEGASIHLPVPAAAAHVALALAPSSTFEAARREFRDGLGEHARLLVEAAREIDRAPDAVFVQVSTDEESVQVRKEDGVLLIEVVTDQEVVRVQLPPGILVSLLEELTEPPRGQTVTRQTVTI